MGTRNLTAVMSDGQYRIAQYGQWDGYPDGQGVEALAFCRENLGTLEGRKLFKQKLARVRWVPKGERPWKGEEIPPSMHRDTGAQILALVHEAREPVLCSNMIDFAGESLFCEWAYVVDLDKGTFEVFRGFNKAPLDPSERFANAPRENDYYPVRHLKTFLLDDLPSERDFLAATMLRDDED